MGNPTVDTHTGSGETEVKDYLSADSAPRDTNISTIYIGNSKRQHIHA